MGGKNPSYCKHCDERGTVRRKHGDTFVMEKCRKCDGTGFNRSTKTWHPKRTLQPKAREE